MKWKILGGKSEPSFNQRLLICNEKTKFWGEGKLKEIKTTESGKRYIFDVYSEGSLDSHEVSDASHFMEIELPN